MVAPPQPKTHNAGDEGDADENSQYRDDVEAIQSDHARCWRIGGCRAEGSPAELDAPPDERRPADDKEQHPGDHDHWQSSSTHEANVTTPHHLTASRPADSASGRRASSSMTMLVLARVYSSQSRALVAALSLASR